MPSAWTARVRPYEFRFSLDSPASREWLSLMQRSAEELAPFRKLIFDSDARGGRITLELDSRLAQSNCQLWVDKLRSVIETRRGVTGASQNAIENSVKLLTADERFPLPFFDSKQFYVINEPIGKEDFTDQSSVKPADPLGEFIDMVREQVQAGAEVEDMHDLAYQIAQSEAERGGNVVVNLGAVAATAAKIAVLTSTLNEQVQAAREAGASWRQIARAADIDVASAHRRWRSATQQVEN